MKITLPAKIDGTEPDVIDTDSVRRAVIIGANGAGKTRFARALRANLGETAIMLSAIDGLYRTTPPMPRESSVDSLYMQSSLPVYDRERPQTPLERLLAMLMADELANLLTYKFAHADDAGTGELPRTRLDRLMELWQSVFPHNRVLIDKGRLLFGAPGSADTFSERSLSNGERAVLYYGAAMLYAPPHAVVIIDSPEMFLHPSTLQTVWNALEAMRPDCTPLYVTHDLEFASSRRDAPVIWVRSCDTANTAWDYRLVTTRGDGIDDQVYLAILGERRPVLFIEGDSHSIDSRLYPLIFPDMSVRPLGSCNKVIEATRTFNDLNALHHMQALGIVDRDRRDDGEVDYLRRKNVLVPEVAEIENLLLLPDIVRAVATARGCNPDKVFSAVRKSVLAMFRHDVRAQALMHTRHRVKRTIEYRIDGRFADIAALERHISGLLSAIDPRALYEDFCRRFHVIAQSGDYLGVLRVYNQKSMLPGCNVASLCGLKNKDEYIETILTLLRTPAPAAATIRAAARAALRAAAISH